MYAKDFSINGLSTWRKHMGTGSSWKAFGNFAEVRCWRPRVTGHPGTVWPSQEEPGPGLTASAPVSGFSAPACTNRVCPPLRPVSVAQKNKPSTMDCTACGSGRWDNRMAAQHLPPNLARPSNGYNSLKRRRRRRKCITAQKVVSLSSENKLRLQAKSPAAALRNQAPQLWLN